MKRKTTVVLLSVILALAIVATACTPAQPAEEIWAVPADENIATLGDTYVTALNYAYLFVVYRNHLMQNAFMSGFGPDDMQMFWEQEQDGVTIREHMLDETLRTAKEYALLYNIAVAAGFSESAESAAQADAQIESLMMHAEHDEQVFLEDYHMTPAQMREAMRQLNVSAIFLTDYMERIVVSEEDIRAVYEADPDAFGNEVTVRHILIGVNEDMDEEEQEAARELAEDLLVRIDVLGEDIGSLVAEYTDDVASIPTEGEYTFGRGAMVAEFEEWAFAAEVGDTGIVRTQFGYHIMQKIRTSFDNAMPHIEHQIRIDAFYESHSELYEMVRSDEWVINQELIDIFIDKLN